MRVPFFIPARGSVQPAQRGWLLVAILIVLALLTACISGCANGATPLARSVQARELYTGTLRVLTDARAAGKVSDADAIRIEAARRVAATALDEMEAAAIAGEQLSFERAVRRFDDIINPLLRQRVEALREAR